MVSMTLRDMVETHEKLKNRMTAFDMALAIKPVQTGEGHPVAITMTEEQADEVYEYLELLDRILTDKMNTQEVYM